MSLQEDDGLPEVVEKTAEEINTIIEIVKQLDIPEGTKQFIIRCIELSVSFPRLLQNKNISLSRLRKLLFGRGYRGLFAKNKAKQSSDQKSAQSSVGDDKVTEPADMSAAPCPIDEEAECTLAENESTSSDEQEPPPRRGHGRLPHTVYKNAITIDLPLSDYQVGDECPTLCGGKLGAWGPGVLTRIKGSNFAEVYLYQIEKLRCNLCGYLLSADIPSDIGEEKYDPTFKSMLALLKYYVAIPFYRLENFQRLTGFPLPDSTQWHLIESLAPYCYPVFNELKRLAANADNIDIDDTKVRILEVINAIKAGTLDSDRTGMYTTGMLAKHGEHLIVLFINGQQHAGENLSALLKNRSPEKPDIIQMCDASSANLPEGLQTILSHCLGHAFRRYDDIVDFFPKECVTIMKLLGKIFKYDEETVGMTPAERLVHHQTFSQPVADTLKAYMENQLEQRLVEPNSELGKAMKYMLKRWDSMTRFLSVAGAKIHNNDIERALKVAIRNRKSAMFYRTVYSAGIGGMITSLIYTCELAKENAFDYLTALQLHETAILQSPEQWLPWNYRETRDAMSTDQSTDAMAQAHPPPLADLAVI